MPLHTVFYRYGPLHTVMYHFVPLYAIIYYSVLILLFQFPFRCCCVTFAHKQEAAPTLQKSLLPDSKRHRHTSKGQHELRSRGWCASCGAQNHVRIVIGADVWKRLAPAVFVVLCSGFNVVLSYGAWVQGGVGAGGWWQKQMMLDLIIGRQYCSGDSRWLMRTGPHDQEIAAPLTPRPVSPTQYSADSFWTLTR